MERVKQYITEERLAALKEELTRLKNEGRQAISRRLEEAKKLGDLAENAEYAEAKEAQEQNERRIAELEQMIKNAVLIQKQTKIDRVRIGSTVTAVNSQGQRQTFTIVGSNEADPSAGKISNESPLGQAFLGHRVGDHVEARTPLGPMLYQIIDIG